MNDVGSCKYKPYRQKLIAAYIIKVHCIIKHALIKCTPLVSCVLTGKYTNVGCCQGNRALTGHCAVLVWMIFSHINTIY